jgi:hypothetical protein
LSSKNNRAAKTVPAAPISPGVPHLSGIEIEEYHARGNEQALESVSQ